jgi:membrane-associated phospholipid phosphatase
MRGEPADTVTSGGRPAPLGARTAALAGEPHIPARWRRALLVALALALAGYAALAADLVHAGAVSELDADVTVRIAESMPTWAEWLARPFTWLGGVAGMTIVVTVATTALLRGGAVRAAVVLLVVTLGSQALVLTAKQGYERPRPDVGSPIDLPSSFSFPSGHATTGIAVFGLLGLYGAILARTRGWKVAAVIAGLALGVLIGASRIVLNVHFVGDVLAGFCLGLSWLVACLLVTDMIRR